MTTREKIRKHLESGKTIDNIKAWELFKTMSLQQHIHALRCSGITIHTEKKHNCITGKDYAVYSIAPF